VAGQAVDADGVSLGTVGDEPVSPFARDRLDPASREVEVGNTFT
jgi:hypothetical protein